MTETRRLPDWLSRPLSDPEKTRGVRRALKSHGLNTVCDEARCPNRCECFAAGTATFMILGDTCTRDCRFCAVQNGAPERVDDGEPERVAAAAAELGLDYIVVTSVTRDDLRDGGASHFAKTVRAIRKGTPGARVELLVPDFRGEDEALRAVLESSPEVLGHNIETVGRLYGEIRQGADYDRSLRLLERAAALGTGAVVKSAMMLGLGEERGEVERTLRDLRAAGARIVCIGQYLRPTPEHVPVARFLPPSEFAKIREFALGLGFDHVSAGPFVRSSYNAKAAHDAALAARQGTA
ncbi:MAG: lipoyl synthase [Candidatus Eisenbacteria bacterium]|nr:lipoyl synthase [Candidatus Eisenbacteria bacterium]